MKFRKLLTEIKQLKEKVEILENDIGEIMIRYAVLANELDDMKNVNVNEKMYKTSNFKMYIFYKIKCSKIIIKNVQFL